MFRLIATLLLAGSAQADRARFEEFKQLHRPVGYESADEEAHRYAIFVETLATIATLNADANDLAECVPPGRRRHYPHGWPLPA